MDEIKKSLRSILYERTTSPFYGTFILSWLIWNWKIIYVTLFISENTIKKDKLKYLYDNHLIDELNLIVWPFFSTIILLTVFPFISNGAFWLKLKFDKWKRDKKNEVQLKQMLTIEESIKIMEQLAKQDELFQKLLSEKDLKISQLEQLNNSIVNANDGLSIKRVDVIFETLESNFEEIDHYYIDLLKLDLDQNYFMNVKALVLKSFQEFEKFKNTNRIEDFQNYIFKTCHILIKHFPRKVFEDEDLSKLFIDNSSWFIFNLKSNQKHELVTAFIDFFSNSQIEDAKDVIYSMMFLIEGESYMRSNYKEFIFQLYSEIGSEKYADLLKLEKIKNLSKYDYLKSILQND